MTGKYNKPEQPVKDKAGKTITGEEQQRNRWVEHFEELLNRPVPSNPPDIQPAPEDLDIDCSMPTREEIRKAIVQLRKDKQPDQIVYLLTC